MREASMREEDRRGGSNFVTAEGLSRPLSSGEQRALAKEAEIRRISTGSPDTVEKRQAAQPTDVALKRTRYTRGWGA
jgi:hypothetical protein